MRFSSLGSGSEGNALLIECRDGDRRARFLVDCGFGVRETQRRLAHVGLSTSQLDAILVTHEHGDHVGGAFRLAAATGIPLYATRGTLWAASSMLENACRGDRRVDCRPIEPDVMFDVCGVQVMPIAVPHDAREPVQFLLDQGGRRLASVTDLGHGSAHVIRALAQLDALVLECNHDPQLLAASDYPAPLKRRVAGPWGHLSNGAAQELLGAIDQSRLGVVVAAHLSRQNNRPDLAREALAQAWGTSPQEILVADQDEGLSWIDV